MSTLTLADRVAVISPAEVEATLLDGYRGYVRLAYLILPPALGRNRRILTAHGVVQRALPERRRLERQLAGETNAADYVRRRVIQDSLEHATSRTPLRFVPSTSSPEGRAAWALVRSEHLSVGEAEMQLRAAGVQHPQAAIAEIPALDENPRATQSAPVDLGRRRERGRAFAIAVTTALTVAILISLIRFDHLA
jgi:hypothetical protein